MRLPRINIWVIISILFWLSCKKEPKWNLGKTLPNVKTEKVEEIKASDIIAFGNIVHNAGLKILRSGFCVSIHKDSCTLEDARIYDYVFSSGKQQGGYGSISMRVDGLEENTSYYVRAFVINEKGTAYGEIITFKTKRFARVVTDTVVDIKQFTAIASGHVENDNGYAVTERGICWGTDSNLSVEQSEKVQMGNGLGSYSAQLTSLPSATKIFYKAYAINAGGASYGKLKSFTTLKITTPEVITTEPVNITASGVECGGEVIYDGGANITKRGVCYGKMPNPDINGSLFQVIGSGAGGFKTILEDLSPSNIYYVRAYATNILGTSYGEQKTFNTQGELKVETTQSTDITQVGFTAGGNVINEGSSPVTQRGICFSTAQGPTISNTKTSDGIGAGVFLSTISGLTPNAKYFYRAYATNNKGTQYGDEFSVTTSSYYKPSIVTVHPYLIASESAYSGGCWIADGGFPITAKGVCWNTSGAPTIYNSVTNEGNDTVAFASKLNSLKPNTKYYVRAYAANAIGITYGNTIEFTTLPQVPSIVTSAPKSITSTEATTGGTAIDDGGSAIISKGICWNTTGNPTIADTSINHGNGNADFTSFLSGLTPGTKYYVRAWAKNSIGIGYGSTITFNTTLKAPSLVTPTGGYLVGTNFELKWTCVTNATSYELQMSTSSSFTGTMWSLPISPGGLLYTTGYHSGVQGGTCTGFGLVFSDKMQSASPAGPGTYTFYWRVRALNSTTIGPWSTSTTSGYPNTFTFQK